MILQMSGPPVYWTLKDVWSLMCHWLWCFQQAFESCYRVIDLVKTKTNGNFAKIKYISEETHAKKNLSITLFFKDFFVLLISYQRDSVRKKNN